VHSPWATSSSKLLLEDRDLQILQGYLTKFPWATFSIKLPLEEWDLEAQPSCPKNNSTFQATWLEYFISNWLRFQVFQDPFSLGTWVPNSWAKVTWWMNYLCVNLFYNLSSILNNIFFNFSFIMFHPYYAKFSFDFSLWNVG
jgi:hypothetical protein